MAVFKFVNLVATAVYRSPRDSSPRHRAPRPPVWAELMTDDCPNRKSPALGHPSCNRSPDKSPVSPHLPEERSEATGAEIKSQLAVNVISASGDVSGDAVRMWARVCMYI